ncbi:P1 family peptidase [Maritalea mediterranea]|uniref:P1 family peptidase n=1 Tax=Maritalea mediterranea TaxID=2909667 RepID=UPI003F702187
MARRGAIGIGRNSTVGNNNSGDIFLAFSTANALGPPHTEPVELKHTLFNDHYCYALYVAPLALIQQ